jgi:hypothetical protein
MPRNIIFVHYYLYILNGIINVNVILQRFYKGWNYSFKSVEIHDTIFYIFFIYYKVRGDEPP